MSADHDFWQCAQPQHQRDYADLLIPQHEYEIGHITYEEMCEQVERALRREADYEARNFS